MADPDYVIAEQQPAWVPELIAVLTDLHRRRASRHAYAGAYARTRQGGQYPDVAA